MSSMIQRIRLAGTRTTLTAFALTMAWWYVGPIVWAKTLTAPGEDVDRIKTLWRQQSDEVVACKFKVILFRYFDSNARLLSRAEAVRRLESVGAAASPTTIEPLFDDVAKRGWKKQQSTLWGTPIDVTVAGSKVANTYWEANGKSVRVYDGDSEISYREANKQASIQLGRSQIQMVDVATLHVVPNHQIAWEKSPRIEPTDDARVAVIRSGGVSVRFDRATGFVHQLSQSGDGVAQVLLQFGPKEVGGVTLARVVADLRIENDNVRMMSIYLIHPQSINAKIPDEAFQVDVPAQTLIVDHRDDVLSPSVVKAPTDLGDVKRRRDVAPEKPR